MSERQAWRSLLIVVLLFAGQGMLGVVEMVGSFAAGQPMVSFGLLDLLVAVGLTARLRGARRVALLLASGQLLLLAAIALLGFPAVASRVGRGVSSPLLTTTLGWLAVCVGVSLFQWRTLRQPAVRALFAPGERLRELGSRFPT